MINIDFIYVALLFIGLDVLTGVVSSFITHTFKSSKMREGGLHKLGLFVVIVFGVALDYSQTIVNLGFSFPFTACICGFLALMEILSCIENINKAYPDVLPKSVTSILYQTAKEKGIDIQDEE